MKKFIFGLLALFMVLGLPINVFAEKKETRAVETPKEEVNAYLFWGNGCGYCEAAKKFFASIEEEYGDYFKLVEYEVWHDEDNQALEQSVAEYLNDDVSGVPYIVIGETTFGGYSSEYNEDIIEAIEEEYEKEDRVDVVKLVIDEGIEPAKNYDTLIVIGIFAVIIGGFGALIYFSRK